MDAPPRHRVTIGNTEIVGPVDGETCPACGATESIYRETDREPHSQFGLFLTTLLLGPLALLTILFPGGTVRMRCAECDCRFPGRLSPFARALLWLLITAVVAGLGWLAYIFRAPLQTWLAQQWRANPAMFILFSGILGSVVLLFAMISLYPARKPPPSE